MSIYLNDKEIAKRLGMSLEEWESIARMLERHKLPRKDPVFQDRRHWGAVQEYLLKRATVSDANIMPPAYKGGQVNGSKERSLARSEKTAGERQPTAVILGMHKRGEREGVSASPNQD